MVITEDNIKAVIAETLMVDLEKVYPTAHLVDDLGADSLDMVELTLDLEEAFDIEIPDDKADRWHTVGDVVDSLMKVTA